MRVFSPKIFRTALLRRASTGNAFFIIIYGFHWISVDASVQRFRLQPFNEIDATKTSRKDLTMVLEFLSLRFTVVYPCGPTRGLFCSLRMLCLLLCAVPVLVVRSGVCFIVPVPVPVRTVRYRTVPYRRPRVRGQHYRTGTTAHVPYRIRTTYQYVMNQVLYRYSTGTSTVP